MVAAIQSQRTNPNPRNPSRDVDDAEATYTVKPGDTLSGIAARNNVGLHDLIANNPACARNPDLIHPGQQLRIPTSTTTHDVESESGLRKRPPRADGTFAKGGTSKATPPTTANVHSAPSSSSHAGDRVDSIIDRTARVEGGGRYDAFNPNDNGHGISFGLIQFNQKSGSLPTLLKDMHAKDPARFNDVFGPHAHDLLSESFVRSANLNTPDLRARFQQAGQVPAFQQAQRDLARREYFEPAQRMARAHGIQSERGVAMLFDASVQMGAGGAERRLRDAAAGGGGEHAVLERFAAAADRVTGAHHRRTNLLNDPTLSDGALGSTPRQQQPDAVGGSRVVVQLHETLSAIAKRHNVDADQLAQENDLDGACHLTPGQVLTLPCTPAASGRH
jgi:LysM repeat protein